MPTQLLAPRLAPPSLKSGYARSASKSANPELWKELLGAWIPALDDSIALRNQVNGIRATVGAGLTATDKTRFKGVSCINYTEATTKVLTITNKWEHNPRNTDTTIFQRINFDNISNYETCFMQVSGDAFVGGKNGALIYAYVSGDVVGPGTATNGVWYSACCTSQSGTTTPTQVWVDGIAGTPISKSALSITNDFLIGADDGNNAWCMDGKISETYLWGRILKPKEIQLLSHDPLAPFRLKPRMISIPAAAAAPTDDYAARKRSLFHRKRQAWS